MSPPIISPLLVEIEQGIESLLAEPPYGVDPQQRQRNLLALLKQELIYACDRNPQFRNYVAHWPIDFREAKDIADLPYLPVGVFKANPPLALVGADEVKRTLTSSATTGQVPSRIVLDAATARRMTKGVLTIVRDFIGSARRPYLVIDTPENLASQGQLGARGAAVQALGSFATEIVSCLRPGRDGDSSLDVEKLLTCAAKWKNAEVLVYGFTYVIWTQLVQTLQRQGITLDLPNVRVLHSGGWKRLLQQAVTRDVFIQGVACAFGCSPERIVDYYGMVENVGVIYPDCDYGNKHVPAFAEVIVRNPLTLAPVKAGQRGLIQVCSVLSTSFPGFLLLTEDMAEVIGDDNCRCGRRGTSFRFAGRVPKAEVRGCGNLENTRLRQGQTSGVA
jgi:phenylacetate-coenzyme A ligase PaaK-like adenylate-forming protein